MDLADTFHALPDQPRALLATIMVNKARARSIGALLRWWESHPPAPTKRPTIDQWNEEFHEEGLQVPEWGLPRPPLLSARIWHNIAEGFHTFTSLALPPVPVERMVAFMTQEAQFATPLELAKLVSKLTGWKEASLLARARQAQEERVCMLKAARPRIIEQYMAFGEGRPEALSELNEAEVERFTESVVEAIPKQRNRFLSHALEGDMDALSWLEAINYLEKSV